MNPETLISPETRLAAPWRVRRYVNAKALPDEEFATKGGALYRYIELTDRPPPGCGASLFAPGDAYPLRHRYEPLRKPLARTTVDRGDDVIEYDPEFARRWAC